MNDLDQRLKRYLLGELSEVEANALEQEYFADPQIFDQVVQAECDLVDQYARGQLSRETRERFEQSYLAHPSRRERTRFAEALAIKTDRVKLVRLTDESWWNRWLASLSGPKLVWGFSLALLLLIAGAVLFAIQARRLHQEVARIEAERAENEQHERDLRQQLAGEQSRAYQLKDELNRLRAAQPGATPTPTRPGPAAPALVTMVLNLSGVRGALNGPAAKLNIPAGTKNARIQLNLSGYDYQAYSVVVQSADGKHVARRDGLRARNKTRSSLSIVIPATRLSSGDYLLTLKGVTPSGEVEDVSKSLFHVTQNHLQ